mmetsp:Transcript_14344/g.21024  ORF Transcript_14344/g.21024 Transcript_14344/m.21024 type:complete len:88 (+) Transcript_14344:126-389(+)
MQLLLNVLRVQQAHAGVLANIGQGLRGYAVEIRGAEDAHRRERAKNSVAVAMAYRTVSSADSDATVQLMRRRVSWRHLWWRHYLLLS